MPFFSAPEIDLSIRWKALLRGAFVGEIALHQPRINVVVGPREDNTQTGAEVDWTETVRELFPLRIDHLDVHDGRVHYKDLHSDPKVDVYLSELRMEAANLTNSRELSKSVVASAEGNALAMGTSPLSFSLSFHPYTEAPTFDLDLELETVELTALNDLLRAYANVDAHAGSFSFYTELAASEGGFEGYAKPFFADVEIFSWQQDKGDGPLRLLWEGIVEGVGFLLESPKTDQIATRIPIQGSVENPDLGLWRTLVELLRNAFVKALAEGIESSLDRGDSLERRLLGEEDPASEE